MRRENSRSCAAAMSANRPSLCSMSLRPRVTSVFGGQHSEFGRIVFSKYLGDFGPYLDPAEGVPPEHIAEAAEKAGVPEGEIEATVRSLSAHMGWDIRVGASG